MLSSFIEQHLVISRNQYWRLKISNTKHYNVIFVGSSRVYRGINPKVVEKYISLRKVYNFGFSACMLDENYLRHACTLLSFKRAKPCLIVGISPHCFIKRKPKYNDYYFWQNSKINSKSHNLLPIYKHSLKYHLNFLYKKKIHRWDKYSTFKQRYFLNGWIATKYLQWNDQDYVKRLAPIFATHPINKNIIRNFFRIIRGLSQKGIIVMAFKPPTCKAMEKIEKQIACFDYDSFSRKFTQSKGYWLDIKHDDFHAFDGSHLDMKQANRLSREIAFKIKERL